MLDIGLRILTIFGISVLALLGTAAALLFLIFFYPVSYRASGTKEDEGLRVTAKASWLAGVLRVKWQYPEPGQITVKLLCFTLFRGKIPFEKKEKGQKPNAGAEKTEENTVPPAEAAIDSPQRGDRSERDSAESGAEAETDSVQRGDRSEGGSAESGAEAARDSVKGRAEARMDAGEETTSGIERQAETSGREASGQEADARRADEQETQQSERKIFRKFQKIKYTISGIYDKIKKIWDTIVYNIELIQEENTKLLLGDMRIRLGKMLKILRPRRMKAEILFGTGSPDTTGYAYGAYCMFSPALGAGLTVTPDFEQAVFRAQFDIAGHFALWVLAVNGLALARDRRLRKLLKKLGARGNSVS